MHEQKTNKTERQMFSNFFFGGKKKTKKKEENDENSRVVNESAMSMAIADSENQTKTSYFDNLKTIMSLHDESNKAKRREATVTSGTTKTYDTSRDEVANENLHGNSFPTNAATQNARSNTKRRRNTSRARSKSRSKKQNKKPSSRSKSKTKSRSRSKAKTTKTTRSNRSASRSKSKTRKPRGRRR